MDKLPLKKIFIISFLLTTIIYIVTIYASYKNWQLAEYISIFANYTFLLPIFYYKKKLNLSFKNKRKLYMPWFYWLIIIEVLAFLFVFPVLVHFNINVLDFILKRSLVYWIESILNILFIEGVLINSFFWFGIVYEHLIKRYDSVFSAFAVGFGMFFWFFPITLIKAQGLDGSLKYIYMLMSFVITIFLAVWLSWLYLQTNRKLTPVIITYTLFILFSYIFFYKETFVAEVLSTFLSMIIFFFTYFFLSLKRLKLLKLKKHVE